MRRILSLALLLVSVVICRADLLSEARGWQSMSQSQKETYLEKLASQLDQAMSQGNYEYAGELADVFGDIFYSLNPDASPEYLSQIVDTAVEQNRDRLAIGKRHIIGKNLFGKYEPVIIVTKEQVMNDDLTDELIDELNDNDSIYLLYDIDDSAVIYTAVEKPAEFPGGQAALMQWLSENIHYPQNAVKEGVQGRVVVQFVIEVDGSVSNPKVLKGVNKDLDQEAVRVVSEMPDWEPGIADSKIVRSYFVLPITFSL